MSKWPKRKIIICRKCLWTWKNNSEKNDIECPKCKNKIDARDRSAYRRKKELENPQIRENVKKTFFYNKKYKKDRVSFTRKRIRALLLVGNGNIICTGCDCDDIRLIEINHKNGHANLEKRERGAYFINDIVTLKRKTDDLDLLCRVCNAKHYLETNFGPLPFKILWKK